METMPFSNHPCFYLLFFLHLASSAGQNLPPYTPTDLILLNCGASSNTTSPDGRIWDSDAKSKFRTSKSETSSSAFTASQQDPSVTEVPYMTARIFNTTFTYAFPVLPGSKFVRFYFYPAAYSDFDITKSFFSIEANNYTLVKNFSAFLTVSAIQPPVAFFNKEFIITVWENQMLNITFNPSPKSFAFINGIEIVSMPNGLYANASGNDNPLTYVGFDYPFYNLDNTTALETVYRLNVGGQLINGVDDTGMYREWLEDSGYIFGAAFGVISISHRQIIFTSTPAFVAPALVYSTMRSMGPDRNINLNYNLLWIFPIDGGFNYLVRLHFCETRPEVTHIGQELFYIFINNQTAEANADVIHWGVANGVNGVPLYRDYVVWVPAGSHGKQDLWLALHPNDFNNDKNLYADAILNGLEIFKLNNSEGSLAGSNPESILAPTPSQDPILIKRTKSKESKIMIVIGLVIGAILALAFVICFFIFKQRKVKKDSAKSEHKSFRVPFSHVSRTTTRNSSSLKRNHFRRFSIFEIEVATTKFDDEFVIGSGGFGNVYKGFIDDGATPVAIKRLHSSSRQGAREFRTEIQMLSKLRHKHLVSLIGYCDDPGEMILVYEYMHRGTLRDHLYKTRNPPLPWKQRLQICIGAAHGLHYLHTGAKHPIIHRDVKSTNILIDENWVAKVSDFGLSRTGPTSESQTHVSTVVRGSVGYVDPEYYRRQHLTEKSDVYSFGVVLFEVLCARPPVIPGLPKEQVNLADLARICYRKGALDRIMDPRLRGDIDITCLEKFGEIADSCLLDNGAQRPTMSGVVFGLELALQIQETAEKNRNSVDSVSEGQESPLLVRGEAVTTDDDDLFSVSGGHKEESRSTVSSGERSVTKYDPDRLKSESVFSEIMNPNGR